MVKKRLRHVPARQRQRGEGVQLLDQQPLLVLNAKRRHVIRSLRGLQCGLGRAVVFHRHLYIEPCLLHLHAYSQFHVTRFRFGPFLSRPRLRSFGVALPAVYKRQAEDDANGVALPRSLRMRGEAVRHRHAVDLRSLRTAHRTGLRLGCGCARTHRLQFRAYFRGICQLCGKIAGRRRKRKRIAERNVRVEANSHGGFQVKLSFGLRVSSGGQRALGIRLFCFYSAYRRFKSLACRKKRLCGFHQFCAGIYSGLRGFDGFRREQRAIVGVFNP